MTTETRNTNPEMQLDLWAPGPLAPPAVGVGARHAAPAPPAEGGGYPSSCSSSGGGFSAAAPPAPTPAAAPAAADRDPRLEELRQLGLGPVWVRVAETIGYETFVAAWAVMSANRDFMDGRNRITIPDISLLHIYQRNLAVRSLARRGFLPRQIRDEMLRTAGLALSGYQIEHIIRDATP